MADNELLAKLSRRQMLNEQLSTSEIKDEAEPPNLNGGGGDAQNTSLPDSPKMIDVKIQRHSGDEGANSGKESPESGISMDSLSLQETTSGHETAGATDELKNRLSRRQGINEGVIPADKSLAVQGSVYAEFHEFSRKQIKSFEATFKKYDDNKDGYLCFEEVKRMMEKLGEPQTHLALKAMIRQVDEDNDGRISFREFLLIFRKAAAGELLADSGLLKLAQMTAVDVTKEGVGGAKNFFEAKIEQITKSNAFEEEIKQEQEEKRKELEEKKARRQEFLAKKTTFQA